MACTPKHPRERRGTLTNSSPYRVLQRNPYPEEPETPLVEPGIPDRRLLETPVVDGSAHPSPAGRRKGSAPGWARWSAETPGCGPVAPRCPVEVTALGVAAPRCGATRATGSARTAGTTRAAGSARTAGPVVGRRLSAGAAWAVPGELPARTPAVCAGSAARCARRTLASVIRRRVSACQTRSSHCRCAQRPGDGQPCCQLFQVHGPSPVLLVKAVESGSHSQSS